MLLDMLKYKKNNHAFMIKVKIKNGEIFCPGSNMIVSAEGCRHCKFRKNITSEYVECTFDEIKYSDKWK